MVSRNNRPIDYRTLKLVLEPLSTRAGIRKKTNPHSSRHARASHLADHLTEAQTKEFIGWAQSSDMASVYVHLSGRDVDDAVLKVYGLKQDAEKK